MTTRNFGLSHQSGTGAVLQVIENTSRQQLVARLVPFGEEHITIHRRADGTFLKTHWMPGKPASTWDMQRIGAGAAAGYANPAKHRFYTVHSPLVEPPMFPLGDHIIGRHIQITDLPRKAKYQKDVTITAINMERFMFSLYFGRERALAAPVAPETVLFEHQTYLGWLYGTASPQ